MTSEAQTAANRLNAQHSSGPRSAEGKARVAQNSVTLGLFATRDVVRPEEQAEYDELRAALEAELLPANVMERTLAMEILHATWRLRRCAVVEASLTERVVETGLDPMLWTEKESSETGVTQAGIDRARAHARNQLRRAAADLSKLQTEHYLRARLAPETAETLVSHRNIAKTLAIDTRRRLDLRKLEDLETFENIFARAASAVSQPITKQTQSAPAHPNAPP